MAFFRSAPPDVKEWIQRQASQGSSGEEAQPSAAGAAAVDVDTQDDLDPLGFDDLDPDEPDDDLLARRRAREARADVAAPASHSGVSVGTVLVVVGAIVLTLAVVFIVWFVGLPSKTDTSATPQMSASAEGADASARIEELTALLAESPEDADAHLELGVLLFNQGDLETAREHWDAVVEIDPDHAKAWYNLGFYHLSTSPADMEAARTAWDKVVELEPDSEMAATVLAHLGGLTAPGESETSGTDPEADPSSPAEDG